MFTYTKSYIENEKQNFIVKREAQINLFKVAIQELEKVKELVKDFDKKVINRRFTNEYEKRGFKGYPKLDIDYNGKEMLTICFSGSEREIYVDGRFKGYLDDNTIQFYLAKQADNDSRLNSDETINNINQTIAKIIEKIDYLNNCINNFDNYLKQSYEIEKMIEEYKKNVPYDVALNITIGRPLI